MYMSEWFHLEDTYLIHIGYAEKQFLEWKSSRSGREYKWVLDTVDLNSNAAKKYTALSEIITGDSGDYLMSNAIAKVFMGGGPHSGIIYPTVAMSGNADNVAIKDQCIDKIALRWIEAVKVTEVKGAQITYDKIDSSTSWDENGEIVWSGRGLNWTLGPSTEAKAIVEDGRWVLRDNKGDEIHPK